MRSMSYPYTGRDGECAHEFDNIYGYVDSYKKYHGHKDLETMM